MIKEARMQIKLSEQLKTQLMRYAKAVDLPASQIIRQSVIEYLQSKGVKV